MSLPSKAIDRLFERLSLTYGRQFSELYQAVDPNAVKALWAHELSGFANSLHRIAWALENLPPRCPNVIEFRNLCREAPRPQAAPLPEPPADPERVRAELAKLASVPAAQRQDPKAWAHRIMARHAHGDRLSTISVRFAREALGIPQPSRITVEV